MIDLAGRPWLAEGTQMLAAIRRSDASHGEVAITRYATGEPVRLEYWAVPVHDNGVTGEMRCPRQRKELDALPQRIRQESFHETIMAGSLPRPARTSQLTLQAPECCLSFATLPGDREERS
jgi:hypothetical protein